VTSASTPGRPESPGSSTPFFLSSFVWNFALGLTYILIPLYAHRLGMTGTQVGTLIALPVFLQIVFTLIGGALSDRLGGKNLALASCVMTSLSAVTFMLSSAFPMMFVAQVMMVMARAMFWPATWSMASQLPGNSSTNMGRLNGVTNLGQIAGIVSAGFILLNGGFNAGFGSMSVAAIIALVLNQLYRQPVRTRTGPAFRIFSAYPMLIMKRPVRYSVLCAYISALPVSLSFSFFPLLLVEKGFDSDMAGMLVSLRAVGAVAAGFVAGYFVTRVQDVRPPLVSALVIGFSVGASAAVAQGWAVAVLMFVIGIGSAIMTVYFQMLISMVSTPEVRGAAMALGSLGWGLSNLTTPLIMGILNDIAGIEVPFYVMGALAVACGLGLATMQRWAFDGTHEDQERQAA
jgi:MFS family permease